MICAGWTSVFCSFAGYKVEAHSGLQLPLKPNMLRRTVQIDQALHLSSHTPGWLKTSDVQPSKELSVIAQDDNAYDHRAVIRWDLCP